MNERAMFGAGCFWRVEQRFKQVEGVLDAAVGYSGGRVESPSYQAVCSDETGHTEVVLLEFDPAVVSYRSLVRRFFELHDPTTLDRQGPDVGSQYRSVIFYFDEGQRTAAEGVRAELEGSGKYSSPIVTAIEPAGEFWRADEYHQRYFERRAETGGQV
jgi:peptide-methionine (S)-S-oxide reductase